MKLAQRVTYFNKGEMATLTTAEGYKQAREAIDEQAAACVTLAQEMTEALKHENLGQTHTYTVNKQIIALYDIGKKVADLVDVLDACELISKNQAYAWVPQRNAQHAIDLEKRIDKPQMELVSPFKHLMMNPEERKEGGRKDRADTPLLYKKTVYEALLPEDTTDNYMSMSFCQAGRLTKETFEKMLNETQALCKANEDLLEINDINFKDAFAFFDRPRVRDCFSSDATLRISYN